VACAVAPVIIVVPESSQTPPCCVRLYLFLKPAKYEALKIKMLSNIYKNIKKNDFWKSFVLFFKTLLKC